MTIASIDADIYYSSLEGGKRDKELIELVKENIANNIDAYKPLPEVSLRTCEMV